MTEKSFYHHNHENTEKTIKPKYDGRTTPANFFFLNGIHKYLARSIESHQLVHSRWRRKGSSTITMTTAKKPPKLKINSHQLFLSQYYETRFRVLAVDLFTNPFEVTGKRFLPHNHANIKKTIKLKKKPANFLFLNRMELRIVCSLESPFQVHLRWRRRVSSTITMTTSKESPSWNRTEDKPPPTFYFSMIWYKISFVVSRATH